MLFTDGEAELLALHPQLPSNLYFFPANMYDYGTAERQYVTVHFAAPGRLYVLLPEDTAEPRWGHKPGCERHTRKGPDRLAACASYSSVKRTAPVLTCVTFCLNTGGCVSSSSKSGSRCTA